MRNPWLALGMMSAAGFVKKRVSHFAQMQMAIAYLKGADIIRAILLYQISINICGIFLAFGFIVMQIAAIFYFPMDSAARVKLIFAAGLFDFTAALALLLYLLSSKLWLEQAAKYNVFLKEFLKEDLGKEKRIFTEQ